MANHKSAKKRIRQTQKNTVINVQRRSKIKTAIRKLHDAIAGKKAEEIKTAFINAESNIMKGVSKGVIKKETASRKVSRLNKLAKAASK